MKSCLDCIPCFFDQALRIGRMATNDERKIKELLDEVGMMLKKIPLESTIRYIRSRRMMSRG